MEKNVNEMDLIVSFLLDEVISQGGLRLGKSNVKVEEVLWGIQLLKLS